MNLRINRNFLAVSALVGAGLVSPFSNANDNPAGKAPSPEEEAKAKAHALVIQQKIDEALKTYKFKSVIKFTLDNTVRVGITEVALLNAAREGMKSCINDKVSTGQEPATVMLETCGLKGAISTLSPHDDYMDAVEAKNYREMMSGKFVGVGIEIGEEDGYIRVENPIEGSPALHAGILPGDIITHIDGDHLKGKGISYGIKLMRGERKTPVRLSILRGGQPIPDITVIRDDIKTQNVKYEVIDGQYGYVSVRGFINSTADDIRKAYRNIKIDTGANLKAIVINLRGNGGGRLDESSITADDLIDGEGIIVSQQARAQAMADEPARARKGQWLNNVEVVVLQDGGSASASEIVAAALQDDKETKAGEPRAVVMGQQSFGKGTVQIARTLTDGTMVKVTTASFHRRNGHSNQHVGVVPDIITYSFDPDLEKFRRERMTERKLPNSIPNPEGTHAEKDRTKLMCGPAAVNFNTAAIDPKFIITYRSKDKPGEKLTRIDFDKLCAFDWLRAKNDPEYKPLYTVTAPYNPAVGIPTAPKAPALTN